MYLCSSEKVQRALSCNNIQQITLLLLVFFLEKYMKSDQHTSSSLSPGTFTRLYLSAKNQLDPSTSAVIIKRNITAM